MITLFKTLDVTALVRVHQKKRYPFHMLMCWCIGRAASRREEFTLLPVGDRLMRFEKLALNTVVPTRDGGINTCDVPFSQDLGEFAGQYRTLTERVRETGQMVELGEDYMVIGTSALARHEIDGAVNLYAGCFNNPFLIWGKYRRGLLRTTLPVSFQFHHAQLDGVPAAEFLEDLQREIKALKP